MAAIRHRPTALSKRKRRQARKRAIPKITTRKIEAKRVVSKRGRTHPMEAPLPGMPEQPQKLLLDSTALRRFKYIISTKTLRIWFVEGGVYDYYNVPESTVLTLADAQSKGRYFYYNIRTTYNYKRVR